MTDNDLAFLKSRIDKTPVKICFTDGEEAIVKILFVSDAERDVTYDVISTNHEKPIYRKGSIVARFDDIKSVSEVAETKGAKV